MKIELELPDWVQEKVIYIFSSNQMVATKQPDGNWFVVTKPCVNCGKCCSRYNEKPFQCNENGKCPYLEEYPDGTTHCKLGAYRPFGCSVDNPNGNPDFCSIVLEEMNDNNML